MKTILKKIYKNIPVFPFIESYNSGMGTIFMMHRVDKIDKNGLSNVENLKITPEYLENVITKLIDMDYEFISLIDLEDRLKNKNKRKFIVFTLDDGYRDNYTTAYPIFKKYNIPFTIYVTSSFPNRTASLWWYSIADLILKEEVIVTADNIIIKTATKNEKENAFRFLKNKILSFDIKNLEESICNYLPNYNFDFREKCKELCMSWDELKKLSNDSLVTIGSHTVNHPALNKLSKKNIINEVMDNKYELEEKLGIKVELFSYPFGGKDAVGKREFDIIDSLNFKNATTTRVGNIFPIHINYLSSLPRIALTHNYDLKKKMFLNPLIINKGKRIDLK